MKTVFADAFYFLALLNDRDDAHIQAVEIAQSRRENVVTKTSVLTEVADALATVASRTLFPMLLHKVRNNPRATIVPPSQDLFDKGVELYVGREDKDWSLTDCISFVVMDEMEIQVALTGDRHFEQAGFTALLK